MMVLLAVRFLAEIGMLICLCVGGWQRGDSGAFAILHVRQWK